MVSKMEEKRNKQVMHNKIAHNSLTHATSHSLFSLFCVSPLVYILGMMFSVDYPFGQSGSPIPAMPPHRFFISHTSSLVEHIKKNKIKNFKRLSLT